MLSEIFLTTIKKATDVPGFVRCFFVVLIFI